MFEHFAATFSYDAHGIAHCNGKGRHGFSDDRQGPDGGTDAEFHPGEQDAAGSDHRMAPEYHRRIHDISEFGGCPGTGHGPANIIVRRRMNAGVRGESREIFHDETARAQDRDSNRNVYKGSNLHPFRVIAKDAIGVDAHVVAQVHIWGAEETATAVDEDLLSHSGEAQRQQLFPGVSEVGILLHYGFYDGPLSGRLPG